MAESPYPWERDGLEYIKANLPDTSPYRAWGLFEFVGLDGAIGEVDLLLLAEGGLFLIELKAWPETIRGDSATWYRERSGAAVALDNPLFAAERKVKRLASLLKQQEPFRSGKVQLPFIESLVFLSHPDVECKLVDRDRFRVCLRDRGEGDPKGKRRGIIAAVTKRDCPGLDPAKFPRNLLEVERVLPKVLQTIGIRPRTAMKKVGDYKLESLIAETPLFQDWIASHVKLESNKRRIRIYLSAQSASKEERNRINKAADREFRILSDAEHPNILPVENQTEHELGPALIFRYDPHEVRLDHFLKTHGKDLPYSVRLSLVRQLVDALRFAHSKKLVHRILTPESVLVNATDLQNPRIRILNWQAGFRVRDGRTTAGETLHPGSSAEEFLDDRVRSFLAPETFTASEESGYKLDIFSLGTLAYFIFAGRAPAQDPGELISQITSGEKKGLSLSGAVDGVPELLDELVHQCTQPDVTQRLDSLEEVSPYLDLARLEDEQSAEEDLDKLPLDAEKGDELRGGLKVLGVLGTGSTAKTLLVERGGEQFALKVANSPDLSARIAEEAEVLRKLHHQNIVIFHELLDFGPLKAILMESVGTTSLGHKLRSEGRLSLELLHRFGSQLLDALRFLEDEGIAHRDIKPDNMGIGPRASKEALRLILYDFSLSGASPSNIRAGTSAYMDPFLELRKPRQWDLAAERFTVATSLYEMATGALPHWGDGQSLPAALDCEVTIEKELFPRAAAEELSAFFEKALRRDPAERFDNGLEMYLAWERIFERIEAQTTISSDSEDFLDDIDFDSLTLQSELAALKLPARILEVLDQENVLTAKDLIDYPINRLRIRRGTGYKTSRELHRLAVRLRDRFGQAPVSIADERLSATEDDGDETEFSGIDPIYAQISKSLLREKDSAVGSAMLQYFGLETETTETTPLVSWPAVGALCEQRKISRHGVRS